MAFLKHFTIRNFESRETCKAQARGALGTPVAVGRADVSFVGKKLSADNTQPLRPGNAGVPGAQQRTGAGQPGKMKTLGTGQAPGEDTRGEPCPEAGRWDSGTALRQHQQIP